MGQNWLFWQVVGWIPETFIILVFIRNAKHFARSLNMFYCWFRRLWSSRPPIPSPLPLRPSLTISCNFISFKVSRIQPAIGLYLEGQKLVVVKKERKELRFNHIITLMTWIRRKRRGKVRGLSLKYFLCKELDWTKIQPT